MVIPLRPVEPRAARHEFHLGREQRRPTHSSRTHSSSMVVLGVLTRVLARGTLSTPNGVRSSSMVVRGREIHGLSRPIPVEGLGQEFGWVQILVDPELVHVQSSVSHLRRIVQLRVMSHSPTQLIGRVKSNRKKSVVRFQAEANNGCTKETQIAGRGPGGGRRVCVSALTPSCAFCDGSSRSTSVHAARVMPT